MKRMFGVIVLAVVFSAAGAVVSFAQVGCTLVSLEALVADADVVVRGTIADLSRDQPKGQFVWIHVTLKVEETLKGTKTQRLTFAIHTPASDKRYQQWKDARQEQLWFLVTNKQAAGEPEPQDGPSVRHLLQPYGGGWSMIRLGAPVPDERGFTSIAPPILNMNFQLLEKPKEILQATRAAAVAEVKGRQGRNHSISIPRTVAQQTGRSGDANQFVVPVDQRLEPLARRLIESPGDLLPRREDLPPKDDSDRRFREAWLQGSKDLLRAEGIKALRYFKSEKNIALLKPFLQDTTSWERTIEQGENAGGKEREYYIRKEAYHTLQEWGVKVARPVLIERLPQKKER